MKTSLLRLLLRWLETKNNIKSISKAFGEIQKPFSLYISLFYITFTKTIENFTKNRYDINNYSLVLKGGHLSEKLE